MVMMLLLLQSLQGRLLPDATASKGRHLALPLAMSINIRVSSYALRDRTQCMTLWLECTQWVSRFDLQHDLAIQEALFVAVSLVYGLITSPKTMSLEQARMGLSDIYSKRTARVDAHNCTPPPLSPLARSRQTAQHVVQAPGSSTACRRHRWWCRAVAAAMRADRGVRV